MNNEIYETAQITEEVIDNIDENIDVSASLQDDLYETQDDFSADVEIQEMEKESLDDEDIINGLGDDIEISNKKASRAFYEKRRENKKLKEKLIRFEESQTHRDNYYKDLATKIGIDNVASEQQFRETLEKQQKAKIIKDTLGVSDEQAYLFQELFDGSNVSRIGDVSQVSEVVANQNMQDDISEFNDTYDENITSYEDVLKQDNGRKILEEMGNGTSLTKAYYMVNKMDVAQKIKKAAHQHVVNKVRGLSHVKQNLGSETVNPITVTPNDMKYGRKVFPKMSDNQIRKIISQEKESGWWQT